MAPPPKVTRYSTPQDFILAVKSSLAATREWQNSIPIGVFNLYNSPIPPPEAPAEANGSTNSNSTNGFIMLSTTDTSGNIILTVSKTPSYNCLGVFSVVELDSFDPKPHIDATVETLSAEGIDGLPTAFNGDSKLVDLLAAGFSALHPTKKRVVISNDSTGAVITASDLSPATKSPKELQENHVIKKICYPKDQRHHELLTEMYRLTFKEALSNNTSREWCSDSVYRIVSRGDVYCYLINDVPVSASYLGRPTGRGKSITIVHTRKEFRRNGYTEKMIIELCRKLLVEAEEGEKLEYLALFFTEGSSAGRMYRRIGFGGNGKGREYVQRNVCLEEETTIEREA